MHILTKPITFLFFSALLIAFLYFGRDILIPLSLAMLLSMLLLPLCQRLERAGLNRGMASLVCLLLLALIIAGVVLVLKWQIQGFAKDLAGIEQRVTEMVDNVRQYIKNIFGVTEQQQKKMLQQQQSGAGGQLPTVISGIISSIMGAVVNTILVLVYIFLFLYFRDHLKAFLLKLAPGSDQEKTRKIIHQASGVARQYLTGLAMMVVALCILYSIGFSIVGVKGAVFFAMLCGILEIVPFIGNITGTTLTVIGALAQGDSGSIVVGILIVYAIVQFVQTYLLEPLVVGAEVNINPLSTILAIVVGETLWGIGGMILAIPLLGMVKIVCDHIEPLKPYGFLIGQEKKSSKGVSEKIKQLFKKK